MTCIDALAALEINGLSCRRTYSSAMSVRKKRLNMGPRNVLNMF